MEFEFARSVGVCEGPLPTADVSENWVKSNEYLASSTIPTSITSMSLSELVYT